MIAVEQLIAIGPEDLEQLSALALDLHEGKRTPTREEADKMMSDKNTILLVVRDGERIVGMATLYIIQKLERRTSYLEDVIVSSEYRGQGLGKRLIEEVIRMAQERGAKAISLTTQSKRVAANKLYESAGFMKRDTNVFRIEFP